MKDRYYIKIFINFRKYLPTSLTFYYIYFFFKLLGYILANQNLKGYESKDNNITSLYSILSKFLLFDSSFNLISIYYQYICIIIFIIFIILCFYLFLLFLNLRNLFYNLEKREDIQLIKYLGKTKYLKLKIKILTYIIVIISLFSQYLKEYLFFGIIIPFINNSNNNLNKSDSYLTNFISSEIKINKKIIMLMNLICFLICFFFDYIIIFINDTKGFINSYGIDIYSRLSIKICCLLFTTFQPIVSCSYIFKDHSRDLIRFGCCFFSILISSIYLLLSFKSFTFYFDSQIPKFIFFLVCFNWYGGIFEMIMHSFITKKEHISQNYSIIKLILNIISSIFLFSLIQNININFFSKNLISNLFKIEVKNRYIGEMYLYIKYYCLYRKESSNFEIYKILYTHRKQCVNKDCFCVLINKKLNIKKISDCLKKEEYAIIGEQEIVNRIYYLFKLKKFTKEIENYIVLHCQYIYSIRKMEFLAFYLCSMYLNSKLKLSFLTKYFLCELKKEIFTKVQSNKDIKKGILITGNLKNIEQNMYYKILKMKKITNFTIFIKNIKKLISINLNNLEKVLSFRKIITKNSKLGQMNEKSFENFLNLCNKVKKNDDYIINTIINYSKYRDKENKRIKNYEISYILTNYFNLIHKKIPNKLESKFKLNYDFNSMKDVLNKDYSEFNMDYPLIISQNKNNNFYITYINDILANHLGFTQEEIKNRDFNDLIPFDLQEEHSLILKQFTHIQNANFQTPYSYILTKNNNLVNISLHSKCLPNIYFFIDIISNIRVIENAKNSILSYHIFLDKKGNFMNTSKEFDDNFFFDIKQLKILDVTFSTFFGLLPLEKKSNKENQVNYLFEKDKAKSIFTTIPNEKMFILRKKKKNVSQLQNKKYHFTSEIYKKDVMIGIQNLNKIIDEKGLDNDWYKRTNCLAQRFQISEENSPRIRKKKKGKVSFFESKNNDEDNYLFYLDYHIKSMGNKRYYIIKMSENTDIPILLKSALTFKKMLTSNKKIPLFQTNITQVSNSKRSEFSHNTLYSSHTNAPLLQSSTLNNENFIGDNNLKNKNNNAKINITHINNISLNNSLMNNSKSPFIEDSKGAISGLNLIQNLANNEIERINQINQNNNKLNYNNTPKKSFKYLNSNKKSFKKNNFLKKFLEYYNCLVFISFGTVIFLSFILLFIKLKKLYNHKDLFQFNVYIEILKTDTYLSFLNSISLCYQSYFQDLHIDYKPFILPKVQSLRDNIASFNVYLDKIKGNNKLNILYNFLYKNYNFGELNINWNIKNKTSSLVDELKLLLYYMNQLYYNENYECNFWVFAHFIGILSDQIPPPTNLELFTFYGIYNALKIYKPSFENITTTTSKILLGYYDNYFNFITRYGILIVSLILICYFIVLKKLTDDKNEIKKILIHLFDIDNNNLNQSIFENQVYCFDFMCKNFTEETIIKFENSKKENSDNILKNLNKKNNKKERKSRVSFKNKNNNENNLEIKENNSEYSKNRNNNIFLPKSVTISYIILTFFLIIICLIISLNIIFAYNTKKIFKFAIIMSMNFLERIPKSFEITFYAVVSMILLEPSYLATNDDNIQNYINDDYLNYYNTELFFVNNSQIYKMKESYYPILFIEGRMVENNIKLFLGQKTSILTNLKKYENKINEKNNFCFRVASSPIDREMNTISTPIEYFNFVNQKVYYCYFYSPKCNEYGIQVELDYIYQELTNIFYDFIKSNDIYMSSQLYLMGEDIDRMTLDFDYIFEYVFRTYSHFILKDIDNIYNFTIKNEIFFSIILLISLFFIFIFIVFWIGKGNNRYKKLLMFFYKMY